MKILDKINECYESAKELIMNSQTALNTGGKRQVISDDLVRVFEHLRELQGLAASADQQAELTKKALAELSAKQNEQGNAKVSVIINIDTLVRMNNPAPESGLQEIEQLVETRIKEAVLVALKANEIQTKPQGHE